MAHELTTNRRTRKVEMAYVGETPWHGLGQRLTEGATIDQWITEAGLDWTIRRVPLHYYADRAETDLRTDPDMVALIRSDSGERLGIVSADYQIVQPYETLEFFRNLVENSGFKIETAGTLFGGKRFWALAKITQAMIAGWDGIGGYYLLSSTADGTRATDGRETAIRVVCNNTISLAFMQDDEKHGFRLSHRNVFNPAKIQEQLGLAASHFETFTQNADDLSKVKVSSDDAEAFILKLLRPSKQAAAIVNEQSPEDSFAALLGRTARLEDVAEETTTIRRPRGADLILDLFSGNGRGATQKGSAGTAWGLVNAVTEYVDHHATSKTQDHRLDRALWGSGDELKSEAMSSALAQFC